MTAEHTVVPHDEWAAARTYQFLDLVPRGRDEPAEGNPQFWVRRHDEYGC